MEIFIIACAAVVALTTIIGTLNTIEKCSYYKWKARNPEAFKISINDVEDDF